MLVVATSKPDKLMTLDIELAISIVHFPKEQFIFLIFLIQVSIRNF